ncbi:MAG: protein translocase subunit SecD [Candidatus Hydrogenedentes bacterium]|nr:protein translocase subunit SecD [Candidatus Hydrogenedentota bacterium]
MKSHLYRSVLIWITIVASVVLMWPTIGWMLLPDDEAYVAYSGLPEAERAQAEKLEPQPGTRQARLEQWKQEDRDPARRNANAFKKFWYRVVRWAQCDRNMVINLGLDLQGGIHMVVGFDLRELSLAEKQEVVRKYYSDEDVESLSEEELDSRLDDVRPAVQDTIQQQIERRINEFEAQEPVIQKLGENQIQIQLPGEKDVDRAIRLIKRTAILNFHLVAGADESYPIFGAISKAFPGEFSAFLNKTRPGQPLTLPAENFEIVRDVLVRAKAQGVIPAEKEVLFSPPPKPGEPQEYTLFCVDSEPIQRGEGLRRAVASPDNSNPGYWQILFQLDNASGAHFGEVTGQNIGRPMAIVVDNVVLSAPTIRDRITTSGQITGNFTGDEARDLSIALNSGSMAVPIREEFTRIIGPSLGADSVRAGVISSLTGLLAVAIAIAAYYTSAGVIAVISLVLNALYIVALMAYFNLTLTLPGIAGLILTIGMAVDSNVLIYERIREELRRGHSLAASVEAGFRRAGVTILDANVTTLLAALILYQFGTGPVKGFSVALSIGVCTTVFCALVVCPAMFDFMLGRGLMKKITMLSMIKPDTRIPFMKYRVASAAVSLVIIAIGLGMFWYRGQDNFGVDFTQGSNVDLTIVADRDIEAGEVRAALDAAGFTSPTVQESGLATDFNRFLIRVGDISVAPAASLTESADAEAAPAEATPAEAAPAEAPPAEAAPSGSSEAQEPESNPNTGEIVAETAATEVPAAELGTVGERIRLALAPLAKDGAYANVKMNGNEQTVGPAVGRQLQVDAIWATVVSWVFMIIYLWLRFEFRFAVGAVAALVHDVLVTVGFLALSGREISMTVVAAILTIIGYSVNDTIVIFDRVRENMQLYRGKGYKFLDLLDVSVNETLARTLLTSLLTLLTVVVLYFFGGESLNDFAFALVVGMVAGCYSTIFIASPVVYYWQRLFSRAEVVAEPGKGGEPQGRNARRSRSRGRSA